MKKVLSLIVIVCLCLATVFCFVACKDESEGSSGGSAQTSGSTKVNVDVNVAAIKNDMTAYTMTNDILAHPDNYNGKTICIKGTFSQGKVNGGTENHYFIDVYDGCCSYSWVSFSWGGKLPSSNTTVTVIGKLRTVTDGSMRFPEVVAESVEF